MGEKLMAWKPPATDTPAWKPPTTDTAVDDSNLPPDDSLKREQSKIYTPTSFVAGAMLGGAAGLPLGPIGAAGGSILGGAAGLLGAKGVDAVRGIGDQPGALDIPQAIGESGIAEIAGQGMTKAAKAILPPLYEGLSSEAKQIYDYAKGRGIPLSLDQISRNPVVKFIGSAFRALPITKTVAEDFDNRYLSKMIDEYKDMVRVGSPIEAVKAKGLEIKDLVTLATSKSKDSVEVAQKGVLDKFLEAHGSPFTYDELTMGDQAAAKRWQDSLQAQQKQLWESLPFDKQAQIPIHEHIGEPSQELLDQMAPYSQLPGTQKLIGDLRKASGAAEKEDFAKLAQQRIDTIYKSYGVGQTPTVGGFQAGGVPIKQNVMAETTKKLADAELLGMGIDANNVMKSPALVQGLEGRTMSFDDLQEMRSTALQMNRQLRGDTGLNTTLSKRWSQYADSLDNAMQAGIAPQGDMASEALTTARTFSRYMHGAIDRDTFQTIINQQNPERIYPYIMKPGNVTPIQETMKIFDPKTRANYQDRWLKESLGADDISPESLEATTQKWGNLSIDSILSKKQAADWYKLPSQLRDIGPDLSQNKLFQSIMKNETGAGVIRTVVGNSLTDNQKLTNVTKLASLLSTEGEDGKRLVGEAVLADILKPDIHDQISGKAVDKMRHQYGEPLTNWLFDKPTQEHLNNYSDTLYHIGAQINSLTNVSKTAPSNIAARMLFQIFHNPIVGSVTGAAGYAFSKGFYNEAFTDAMMKGAFSNPYSVQSAVVKNLPRLFGGAFLGGGNKRPTMPDTTQTGQGDE
jgi:hypothetical protein